MGWVCFSFATRVSRACQPRAGARGWRAARIVLAPSPPGLVLDSCAHSLNVCPPPCPRPPPDAGRLPVHRGGRVPNGRVGQGQAQAPRQGACGGSACRRERTRLHASAACAQAVVCGCAALLAVSKPGRYHWGTAPRMPSPRAACNTAPPSACPFLWPPRSCLTARRGAPSTPSAGSCCPPSSELRAAQPGPARPVVRPVWSEARTRQALVTSPWTSRRRPGSRKPLGLVSIAVHAVEELQQLRLGSAGAPLRHRGRCMAARCLKCMKASSMSTCKLSCGKNACQAIRRGVGQPMLTGSERA